MLSRRTMLLAPLMLAPTLLPASAQGRPLWPGARYTEANRAIAIRRGMRFLHRIALHPRHFTKHGDDLLWCFYTIAATAADPDLQRRAWRIGQERARHWRQTNARKPGDANAQAIVALVGGSLNADRLGARDETMREELQAAASRFGPEAFLKFDPNNEPVPGDVPQACAKCEKDSPRGTRFCRACGTALEMASPYDVLCEALTTTYTGDCYGVRLGAPLADVMQWLPRMRPLSWL